MMIAQLYVCEQPDSTFSVYSKDNDIIPVFTAKTLHSAVDYCYEAGYNFEVEVMTQILADFERPQVEE